MSVYNKAYFSKRLEKKDFMSKKTKTDGVANCFKILMENDEKYEQIEETVEEMDEAINHLKEVFSNRKIHKPGIQIPVTEEEYATIVKEKV